MIAPNYARQVQFEDCPRSSLIARERARGGVADFIFAAWLIRQINTQNIYTYIIYI